MNAYHVKYLLIGGGLASSSAAEAIREIDSAGTLMLVGQEIVRPYHRPPLSKGYLRREKGREDLFTHGRSWFESHAVELRTGRRAVHLDVARGSVSLDNGETIAYDKLLLATGSTPLHLDVPGANLPNLFYLRTLEDIHRIQTALDKAKHEGQPRATDSRIRNTGKCVVIGAGFLGVELAASLAHLGISVDLLCGESQPWDKFAGEMMGQAIAAFLTSNGVRVHSHARPQRIEGDGRVQRIVLGDGHTIDCDVAIACVGGMACRELLRGTPIDAEKAILTDTHCRTNIENIFAAGDCAAVFDPLFGKHRILDHWDNAILTGIIAGRNMAGGNEAYGGVNHFFSDVLNLTLNGWGESRLVYRRLIRSTRLDDAAPPLLVEFGIAADGRIAQILCLGRPADQPRLRELVARRLQTDGLEEKLKDPTISVEELMG